jgi:GTPase Era involved in 16S rRNA processing
LCVDGLLKENKMDEITSEQIAQNYTAMGHSVQLITDVIAGDAMADDAAEERQSCVDRNVEHLQLMVAKDYWTDEDMTAVNAAITAGNGYTAS